MTIDELNKYVKVYGKDSNNKLVTISLKHPIIDLIEKQMIHSIVINSNNVSLRDVLYRGGCPVIINVLPEIIYGENVDSPQPFGISARVITSLVFKTKKKLNLAKFFSHNKFLSIVYNIDCPTLVDASYMFYECSSLVQIKNINTSKVININNMFEKCTELNGKISLRLPACQSARETFSGCRNIRELEILEACNIVSLERFCISCEKLETVVLLNTSKVENFSNSFCCCKRLQKISLLDFSSAINASGMFYSCKELISFKSKKCKKLQDASSMFAECKKLVEVDIGDYNSIKDKTNCFLNCSNLQNQSSIVQFFSDLEYNAIYHRNNVILNHFPYNTVYHNVRNINLRKIIKNFSGFIEDSSIFNFIKDCKQLKYVELPSNIICVFKDYFTYTSDKILYIDPFMCKSGTHTWQESVRRDREDERHWETRSATFYLPTLTFKFFRDTPRVRNTIFKDFKSSHGNAAIPKENIFFDSWKKSMLEKVVFYAGNKIIQETNQDKLLNMLNSNIITMIVVNDNFVMFDVLFGSDNIVRLPTIKISSNVISCRGMFSDLTKLKYIEKIIFSSSKLEDLTAMFLNCKSLINIPDLIFSNCTILDYIFSGCCSLQNSPHIEWQSSSSELISMFYSFENCVNLKRIVPIKLNGRTVNDIKGLFFNCFSLESYPPLKLSKEFKTMNFHDLFFGDTKVIDNSKLRDLCRYERRHAYNEEQARILKIESEIKDCVNKSSSQLIKCMFRHTNGNDFNDYALEDGNSNTSLENLVPIDYNLDFENGIIDGVHPKYGIFVYIFSKKSKGLIHISKLNTSQRKNLSQYKKGDAILIKIVKEYNNKIELDFYNQ